MNLTLHCNISYPIASTDVASSRIKRRSHDDVELRRTKRTVYQALLKKQDRRNADDEGVDIDERSLINKPQIKKKPYVKQQGKEITNFDFHICSKIIIKLLGWFKIILSAHKINFIASD